MRRRTVALPGAILGTLMLAGAAAAATPPTPVVDKAAPVMHCPVVKGDDPLNPKVVPNLTAGREELSNNHFQRAAAHFKALAEDGNVDAQVAYGQLLLRDGCNIPTDKDEGLKWLHKAAEAGNTAGQFAYANALLHGNGTVEDDKGAYTWLKKAASADHVGAETMLGYLYLAGRGVKANPHEAVVWTVKAAEQGDPTALANLARIYLRGNGVPKDLHQAMFFIAAAQQRIPPTQYQMMSRIQRTRYAIAHLLSVEEVRTVEKDAEKWAPGSASLAKVLADADKWKPEGPTNHDMAD